MGSRVDASLRAVVVEPTPVLGVVDTGGAASLAT